MDPRPLVLVLPGPHFLCLSVTASASPHEAEPKAMPKVGKRRVVRVALIIKCLCV